jgi:hypothetical protein
MTGVPGTRGVGRLRHASDDRIRTFAISQKAPGRSPTLGVVVSTTAPLKKAPGRSTVRDLLRASLTAFGPVLVPEDGPAHFVARAATSVVRLASLGSPTSGTDRGGRPLSIPPSSLGWPADMGGTDRGRSLGVGGRRSTPAPDRVRVPSRNRAWSLLVSRSVRDGSGVIAIGMDFETVTPWDTGRYVGVHGRCRAVARP